MTEREIFLEIRMPDNKFKKFTQDFVPYSKRQEYIRLEKELEEKYKGSEVPEEEYINLQANFVANLFENETVTKDLILNGLDSLDRDKIYNIIRYRVLGYSKSEDERLKKLLTENESLLLGKDSTNSK